MQFLPCIIWSGSKRRQSAAIVNRMPRIMDVFWIPFIGGGSVMYQLINSNIKYNHIIASDIYKPLIDIWKYVQDDVDTLLYSYIEHYGHYKDDPNNYYKSIVDKFNSQPDDNKDPLLFHFITRSCMRGSISFDNNGNFITKNQMSIISPKQLYDILKKWSTAIYGVEFRCESYNEILGQVTSKDYCFFDPPYIDGTWYRHNNIDMRELHDFLRHLPSDYSMTLNGNKEIYPLPDDLYTLHEYIYYNITRNTNKVSTGSRDSLWMRHKLLQYNEASDIGNIRRRPTPTGGEIPQNDEFNTMIEIGNRLNVIEQHLKTIMTILSGGI